MQAETYTRLGTGCPASNYFYANYARVMLVMATR
jgi:hypothetical protein